MLFCDSERVLMNTMLPGDWQQTPLRAALTDAYLMDESVALSHLLSFLNFSDKTENAIRSLATKMVQRVRDAQSDQSMIESLMMQYDLSTEEGILLMCLAEALLRIPDAKTEDLLIRDKLTGAQWRTQLDTSESAFVQFASWGLALSGKLLSPAKDGFWGMWKKLVARSGEPLIRQAVREAMKVMGQQFVIGRTVTEALKRSKTYEAKGYSYSYDMLGEVALTQSDADRYFRAYQEAIETIGQHKTEKDLYRGPSISIKLSALFPRYEFSQRDRAVPFLIERLKMLALAAKKAGMSLTVDAEEAARLDISLTIFEAVFKDPGLSDWEGLGLAVQAYQKRAFYLIDWLVALSAEVNKRIQVRLVKGAYWDSEIKFAQMEGLVDYPVFTRKNATDVSYLACAKKILGHQSALYPQFATHNAYSVAAILTMMQDPHAYQFEFQNLQGMGKALHDQITAVGGFHLPSRIYAPVGSHEDLLPYLVRRLLENGANSSFVNQISDPKMSIDRLIESPVKKMQHLDEIRNPAIPLPSDIYGEARQNAAGIDLTHYAELKQLSESMQDAAAQVWTSAPSLRAVQKSDTVETLLSPANHRRVIGRAVQASEADCLAALDRAEAAFFDWNALGPLKRARILQKMANLLEKHHAELMAMSVLEGGRTIKDANAEVREAIDFCRYYALMAKQTLMPQDLQGYTGETNTLVQSGRGVMLCISPWNFPVAIFTGQVAAALVAGNAVIAKPAEATRLVAARVVELFYQAGVPEGALRYLPAPGAMVGKTLVANPRISGVLLTGSNATARRIAETLAKRPGPIVPFIAETGGINAMIADSSSLPEQLVHDVMTSAFSSAGQRCSALRLLLVQADIADKVINMLKGAMAEMRVGDPACLSTDVGPVINQAAQAELEAHAAKMAVVGKTIYRVALNPSTSSGSFVAPQAFEIPNFDVLEKEVFGPILHVMRYPRRDMLDVIDRVNAYGYGLTFGIHSRIDSTVQAISKKIHAGNIYVNRNMIGAVVGLQPFGGGWLSGTGPKAGGPHYLLRLCQECTITVNTTAAGGNATLMAASEAAQ